MNIVGVGKRIKCSTKVARSLVNYQAEMEQSFIQPTINCLPKIIILFYVPWRLERENNFAKNLLSLGLQFWFSYSSEYSKVECFQTDRRNFDAECEEEFSNSLTVRFLLLLWGLVGTLELEGVTYILERFELNLERKY
ncbi:hypothetical protein CDAR_415551 [Caerostris darwini]|uniref:Uncharacterized protein n=1 Tax=Caerostris darwini TaxID=1538125 RepID=A0AAV4Q616_9ARAC|nr:hypothetical protein CDAR_415551 [Caerostris darwini]